MTTEPTNTAADELGKINVADAESTFGAIVKETKAGYKTTEFWGVLGVAALDLITQLPIQDKAIASFVAGLYAVARGFAKSGIPHVEEV